MAVAQFFERIAGDSSAALELILRLSARLRSADDELVRYAPIENRAAPGAETSSAPVENSVEPSGAVSARDIAQVTISAASPQLRALMGEASIPVLERPFVIGRQLEFDENWPEYEPQLVVNDTRPFRISRNHFAVDTKPGHVIVRDLNSKMGTTVNGLPIGRHFARDSVELSFGANTIVAGGLDSRFQFTVTVV